jgi:hypothetical protein
MKSLLFWVAGLLIIGLLIVAWSLMLDALL